MAKNKIYELYKKSKFICLATLDEICEITGYSKSYVYQCVKTDKNRNRSSVWNIYRVTEER